MLCIAPVVFLAAWTDLRSFRIPNRLCLAGIAIFVVTAAIFLPLAEIPGRLMGAGLVLLVGFVLFSAGLMGGGDAKMATVIALFIPGRDAVTLLVLLALCGLAGLVVVRLMAPRIGSLPMGKAAEWEVWTTRKQFPYGYAMAGALALYIFARLVV